MDFEAKKNAIRQKVDTCNELIHNIDEGIEELDVIEELKSYADLLSEVWQTENGENTIKDLNNAIDALKISIDSIKRSIENIKSTTYTCDFKFLSEEYV